MKIIIYLALAYTCVFAYENSNKFINEINRKQNMWVAGRNFDKNMPLSEIKMLLGVKNLPNHTKKNMLVKNHYNSDDIPETFDARLKWSSCKTVKEVADQSACGSCWVGNNFNLSYKYK